MIPSQALNREITALETLGAAGKTRTPKADWFREFVWLMT